MSLNPIVANSVQYILGAEFTSGSFTNITDDLIRFNCIRDVATLNKPITIGQAALTLDNTTKKYSPANSSGIYYDMFKVGVNIRLQAVHQNSTRSIFSGVIQNIGVNPNISSKIVNVGALDTAVNLQKADVRLSLYQDIKAEDLFKIVTSEAGITQTIYTETLAESIPYAGESSNKASTIIQKILDLGHYYFNLDGNNDIHLRNRHFTLGESPVASLSEFYTFDYNQNINTVNNYVKVKSSRKALDTVVNTIAFLSYPQIVPNNSWVNFFIDFINPYNITQITEATSVSLPIADTDWKVTPNQDGTGSLYTNACSLYAGIFGDSAICSLYNGAGSDAYLSSLNFRGYSIYPVSGIQSIRESTASQSDYGRIDLSLTNEYIADISYADSYAGFLRDKKSDPENEIQAGLNSIFPEVLDIELGKIIHVNEEESSTLGDHRVMSLEHDITLQNGAAHITRMNIETYVEPDYFKLDDAIKGTLDTAGNTLLF